MTFITFLYKNKWILLIGVVLVLLLIPFLLFLIKGQSLPNSVSEIIFPASVPTPTPYFSTPLEIVSLSPSDNGDAIDPKTTLIIAFSRPVSTAEQTTISIRTSPPATMSASWSDDKTTLTLTPSAPLLQNTQYLATVVYGIHATPWSFTTAVIPSVAPEVQKGIDQQAQLDQQWSDYQNKVQKDFPWYDELPLSGDTYFVVFETHSAKFTVDLYPNASIEQQDVERMKQEIQSRLEDMGVNLQTYPIIWNITPISPTPEP